MVIINMDTDVGDDRNEDAELFDDVQMIDDNVNDKRERQRITR